MIKLSSSQLTFPFYYKLPSHNNSFLYFSLLYSLLSKHYKVTLWQVNLSYMNSMFYNMNILKFEVILIIYYLFLIFHLPFFVVNIKNLIITRVVIQAVWGDFSKPFVPNNGTCVCFKKVLINSVTIVVKLLPHFFLINKTFGIHFFCSCPLEGI